MSTYESFQSNAATVSNSLTITKPTSLAVGDLMLAQIGAHRNNASTIGLNTPSGWTLESLINDGVGFSVMGVYSKIADSADVAASNFTFTSTGGSSPYILGHLIRFTNFGITAGVTNAGANGSSTTLTSAGFTPTLPNCTYVFFASADSNVSVGTITGYSFATDNPTWTERSEIGVNTGNYDTQLSFATATRAAATATGTVTMTKSTSDTGGRELIVLALAPKVSGSTTVVTGETFIVNQPFLRNGVTQIDGVDPEVDSMNVTQWTNPDKPSSTWTNPAK